MPWPGEEGLARGRDEELWPPPVFAMTAVCMDEGFRRGGLVFRRGGLRMEE